MVKWKWPIFLHKDWNVIRSDRNSIITYYCDNVKVVTENTEDFELPINFPAVAEKHEFIVWCLCINLKEMPKFFDYVLNTNGRQKLMARKIFISFMICLSSFHFLLKEKFVFIKFLTGARKSLEVICIEEYHLS